ncbi:hypothetical protein [Nocardia seriolae]|uniref:hypothetical protein n=1 Tax=Nocardia seriolae TaxID=37332 RepID=UPI001160C963|nr:hypothetical protein [Nocardia seriolae]
MSICPRWTGAETKAFRDALRMTKEEFAAYLGVSYDAVKKWERRLEDITLRPNYAERLDQKLGAADVAAVQRFWAILNTPAPVESEVPQTPSEGAGSGVDDDCVIVSARTLTGEVALVAVSRRSLVLGIGAGVIGSAATSTLAIGRNASGSRALASMFANTSIDHLAHFDTMRMSLIESDNLYGAARTLPHVLDSLALLGELRRGKVGDARGLLRMQAMFAETAAWQYQDQRDFPNAQHWAAKALQWSHQLADDYYIGLSLVRMSQLACDQGDASEAEELADAAHRSAPHDSLFSAAALTFRAHALALAGDSPESARTYDTARTGLHRRVEDGPDYEHLLDVVAASHTADLDSRTFITEINQASHPPLTRATAASSVLAARGQAILDQHQHARTEILHTEPIPLPPNHPGSDHDLAAHAIQLREQLHALEDLQLDTEHQADPLRALDNRDLNARIRALRATLNRPNPAPVTAPGEALAAVEAEHVLLHTQADLVRAALIARSAADTADTKLATATTALSDAQRRLDALPAYRIGARRATEAERDNAQHAQVTVQMAAQQAHRHAEAARADAVAAGAAPDRWQAILDRDADSTGKHGELAAARRTDTRAADLHARQAKARATTTARLEKALAERDRRRSLSPVRAAAEQRLRDQRAAVQAAEYEAGRRPYGSEADIAAEHDLGAEA